MIIKATLEMIERDLERDPDQSTFAVAIRYALPPAAIAWVATIFTIAWMVIK